jgi:16S rRNA (uracil1498-N3)-methyltransferase
MADRFFHELPLQLGPVRLGGTEAHHLIHVLRAKAGLEVVLFDGSGAEFAARVERVERSAVELIVCERRPEDRELTVSITLGVALPKGDRQRWLIEKCTEIGVAELVPLETTRGVAQPSASAVERLRRTVIEASKQCGRNRLMNVRPAQSWDAFTSDQGALHCRRWLAHPGGTPLSKAIAEVDAAGMATQGPAAYRLAIGPEGGLTEEEVRRAITAGWLAVDLGRRLLRVETAAIALAAVVALK